MTSPAAVRTPLRLDAARIPPSLEQAVLDGAVVASAPDRLIEVTGPGAVTCLQGLLTCDLAARDDAFLYGATLSRFGMIISDLWASIRGDSVTLAVPPDGWEGLLEVLRRSLPPRLARCIEREEDTVLRLAGPRAPAVAHMAGFEVPAPGASRTAPLAEGPIELACAPLPAPFALQLTGPPAALEQARDALTRHGGVVAGVDALEYARVLAGWPALGYEIDAKTLPQEVRYDELGGVSYTKGCYLGQETVARVHFRGHPNRQLCGLVFTSQPDGTTRVEAGAKEVGRVTAEAWVGRLRRWLGLAILRREVEAGSRVQVSGSSATVVPLPFALELA